MNPAPWATIVQLRSDCLSLSRQERDPSWGVPMRENCERTRGRSLERARLAGWQGVCFFRCINKSNSRISLFLSLSVAHELTRVLLPSNVLRRRRKDTKRSPKRHVHVSYPILGYFNELNRSYKSAFVCKSTLQEVERFFNGNRK